MGGGEERASAREPRRDWNCFGKKKNRRPRFGISRRLFFFIALAFPPPHSHARIFPGRSARWHEKDFCPPASEREAALAPPPSRTRASLASSFLWLACCCRRSFRSTAKKTAPFAKPGARSYLFTRFSISPLPLNCDRHAGNAVERKKRVAGVELSGHDEGLSKRTKKERSFFSCFPRRQARAERSRKKNTESTLALPGKRREKQKLVRLPSSLWGFFVSIATHFRALS